MKNSAHIDKKLHEYVQAVAAKLRLVELSRQYFLFHPSIKIKPIDERESLAEQKSQQAAWLTALAILKPLQVREMGFSNKDEFYLYALSLLSTEKWMNWKCTSLVSLRKRLSPFYKMTRKSIALNTALETLISKKIGNKNATKLGEEQKAFILKIYSESLNTGYKTAFKIYADRSTKMVDQGFWNKDESKLSLSGLRSFLMKPDSKAIWSIARSNLTLT